MALVTRYFQTAAATWVTSTAYNVGDYVLGTDNKNWRCITAHTSAAADRPITGANYATYWEECDGTTWDKRAAIFAGGAWSGVIRNFNFASGSDGLLCLIKGGETTTITTALSSAHFLSGSPTVGRPLFLQGCDSSGAPLSPPDENWTSDQPTFDTSTFPTLACTTNIYTVETGTCARCIKFTGTGNTSQQGQVRSIFLQWCYVTSSASATGAIAYGAGTAENCVFECTGTSYNYVCGAARLYNCRIIGNSSATSGNRHGMFPNTNVPAYVRVTSINNPGIGLGTSTTSTNIAGVIFQCTVHGNGYGIRWPSTASQVDTTHVANCYIAGNITAGIDGQSQGYFTLFQNRLRDNGTSGNFSALAGNPITNESNTYNYTTDSDDASELVNVAGGDYRIKNTATIWGKGFGVSEEPPASSAGGSFAFIG